MPGLGYSEYLSGILCTVSYVNRNKVAIFVS